jgi:hypothetical protein
MSEKLSRRNHYPVVGGSGVTAEERKARAFWTGVCRAPKKGEWYLSGAIIEAYKAPNNLTIEYPIAKLMLLEAQLELRIYRDYGNHNRRALKP